MLENIMIVAALCKKHEVSDGFLLLDKIDEIMSQKELEISLSFLVEAGLIEIINEAQILWVGGSLTLFLEPSLN